MKTAFAALIFAFFAAYSVAPAIAQSIDLPRLTWPTEPATPVTQGCSDPTQISAGTDCAGK